MTRAEGLLLQAQKKLREDDDAEVVSLLTDFYTLLPHRLPLFNASAKLLSEKLDLCQVTLNITYCTHTDTHTHMLESHTALIH